MNKYLQILIASGIVLLGSWSLAFATSIFIVQQGGTGVNTFTSSQLIYGNGTSALSSVATTTLLGSGVISVTAGAVVIGASPITVSCSTCGTGTLTAVTGTYPIISSGGTTPAISIAFGTTTSNTWAGTQTFTNPLIDGTLSGLIAGNSGTTYASAATTSVTCSGGSSCTTFTAIGSSPIIINSFNYPFPSNATTTQLTFTNPIVGTQAVSDNSTKAASTAYVTAAVIASNPAVATQAATTAASDTSSLTYNNGVSGIGATFTGSNNTAITVDGFTFNALGQRLLVKNDTQSPSGAFNGVYYVTQVQTAILPPILTRALDYDMPSDINNTGAIPVVNGTMNALTSWLITSTVNTIGTDPLTYSKFSFNPTSLVTAVTATAPLFSSGGQTPNITWFGLATTTQPSSSNLLVSNGTAGVYGVATTSETCSTGIACTAHAVLTGGGAITLASISAGVLGSAVTGVPTSQATSTLYGTGIGGQVLMWSNVTNGLVFAATSTSASSGGIGDPFTHLSVWGQTTSATSTLLALTGSPYSLVASSTVVFTNASSTMFTSIGNTYLGVDTVFNRTIFIATTTAPTGGNIPVNLVVQGPHSGTGVRFPTGIDSGIYIGSAEESGGSGNTAYGLYSYMNGVNSATSNGSAAIKAQSNGNTSGGGSFNAAIYAQQDQAFTSVFQNYAVYSTGGVNYFGGNTGISSTTPGFRFSINTTGTEFYVDSNGKIVGRDTANSWIGRISPTHSFILSTATTTGWTASTTSSVYSPYFSMPFAGTLRQVRCLSDVAGLGVNVQINGSNVTPSYFIASTTPGVISFTSGNTFTLGQKILANFGTTTTSTTGSIACTFDVTET